MAKMTFFESYYTAIKKIKDPEKRLEAFETVCGYGIYGEIPDEMSEIVSIVFDLVKPNIDSSEKSRENGNRGGRPRKEEKEKPTLSENKNLPFSVVENPRLQSVETEKEKEKEREKEKEKEVKKRASAFTPPTIDQVSDYCRERNNGVDPNKWWDFYQSKNWMIGKSKMSDWKAAVRTWEQRENHGRGSPQRKPSCPQRSYDFDDLEKRLIKN